MEFIRDHPSAPAPYHYPRSGILQTKTKSHQSTYAANINPQEYNKSSSVYDPYVYMPSRKPKPLPGKVIATTEEKNHAIRLNNLIDSGATNYQIQTELANASWGTKKSLNTLNKTYSDKQQAKRYRAIRKKRIHGGFSLKPQLPSIPSSPLDLVSDTARRQNNLPTRDDEEYSQSWMRTHYPDFEDHYRERPLVNTYYNKKRKPVTTYEYKPLPERLRTQREFVEKNKLNSVPEDTRTELSAFRNRDKKSKLPPQASPEMRALLEGICFREAEAIWCLITLNEDLLIIANDLANEIKSPSYTDPARAHDYAAEMLRRREHIIHDMSVIKERCEVLSRQLFNTADDTLSTRKARHLRTEMLANWPINGKLNLHSEHISRRAGVADDRAWADKQEN